MEQGYTRFRFVCFRVFIVAAFAVIVARLWELQIASAEEYKQSADLNRFRLVPINAPRGLIYDRFGRVLVRNKPSFAASIVPAGLPEDEKARAVVLTRLGELLGIPVGEDQGELGELPGSSTAASYFWGPDIETILEQRTFSPHSAVRIANNVDRQVAFLLEEEHLELPGVVVEVDPLRHYLDGPLTCHVLGYVGYIPSDDLQAYLDAPEEDYRRNDLVGLTGVELTYESMLRGRKGQKHVEVDAFEREVKVITSQPPEPGCNLILTIDLELQRVVENELRDGMRRAGSGVGVAIAMDPRTGEILALVSLPTYDNNLFSGGISHADYAKLSTDRHRPLMNYALSGQYPPGSTFKIVSASAVLEEGVVTPSTRLTCEGTLHLPNKLYPDDPTKAQEFYCWRRSGHGALNIVGAIQQSCDIYFYQAVGGYKEFDGLGMERFAEYAAMFGFGEPSGVDLPAEVAGLVPTDRWKRQNYGENWVTGDTYNAAIGQGYILATPLQVLNATAAVANGGTLYRPQIVYQIRGPEGEIMHTLTPEAIRDLGVSAEHLALVREGMLRAVQHGTAWLARLPGVPVAGKTGTAEYPGVDEEGNLLLDEEGNLPTHAWFSAFAPYESPEIAVVVFLEGGGEGSQMAAPVTANILRYYFGLPEGDRD